MSDSNEICTIEYLLFSQFFVKMICIHLYIKIVYTEIAKLFTIDKYT